MDKIFIEDFKIWESGANKGKIDWVASVGSEIRFIYKGISGVIKILERCDKNTIRVEYQGVIKKMRCINLARCKLGAIVNIKIKYKDVIYGIERFIKENDSFPLVTDMAECEYLYSYTTIKNVCEDNGLSVDDLARKYGYDRGKNTLYTYEEYVERLVKISESLGRYIKSSELHTHNLPDSRWFVQYCPDKNITNYSEFVEWVGMKPTYISKEKCIELVRLMELKLNRPLLYDDFKNPSSDCVGIGAINRYWGSINKMKEDLGLTIVQEDMISKSKSKGELLSDLKTYIDTHDKIPNTNDFGKDGLMSSCTYFKYFGGINNAIEAVGYAPTKRLISLYLSNDEILEMYRELFDDNGMALTYEYCSKNTDLPSPTTILRRLNCTWNEFLMMLGYNVVETPLGHQCEAKDGTICLSKSECLIHNTLLGMELDDIEKEVLYRDICDGYNGFKRCDWVIKYGGKKYIIEYFGLMQRESYVKIHDEKISLIQSNNLDDVFIPLYPKDLKNIKDKIQKFISQTEKTRK